jgi:hypothetical protein
MQLYLHERGIHIVSAGSEVGAAEARVTQRGQ